MRAARACPEQREGIAALPGEDAAPEPQALADWTRPVLRRHHVRSGLLASAVRGRVSGSRALAMARAMRG